MNLFFDLPLSPEEGVFHAVVEIPKNSRVKYEYSEKYGTVMVDRVFRTPVAYPQNYGFFPRTWNKFDNDPMDVIVISSEEFHPGVTVPVRIVGIIEMDDTGELDHKILAIPTGHTDFEHVTDIHELDAEIVENLEWFLEHYKDREKGKEVKILGTKGAKDALKFLEDCAAEFKKQDH
ncbi:MAG: inorganic diphosphatase [Candidatus Peregrinibacteria bacterium]|nr:inorganic diphosphatase [Candidatus Peregrinibacteria bacterium]